MTDYVKGMVDKAVESAAAAAIAALGADVVNVLDVDWVGLGAVAAGAALLTVLSTVARKGIDGKEG